MTAPVDALPRWDLSAVYPSLDSDEFADGTKRTYAEVDAVVGLFDELGIHARQDPTVDDAKIQTFEAVLSRYNRILDETETLDSYLHGYVATDARNDLARACINEFEQRCLPLTNLRPRLVAWIGSLDLDSLLARSVVARDHEYFLRRCRESARHLMSPPEETLAAEFHLWSGGAWSKLHTNLTARLVVPFERDGATEQLSMTAIRNLAFDADRDVRRRAYEAEIAAWESVAVPLAAALNGVKGETNALSARRAWKSPLDLALFNNYLDRETLDALLAAAKASFPDFRRYFRAKARLFGVEALPWFDLIAPLRPEGRSWSYADAEDLIMECFGSFSPRLRNLAVRAFRDNWIDAGPRAGKVGGAFCMSLQGDECRILMNYAPSYGSVGTLAHELGHAYHNHVFAHRTHLQRILSSSLAETASTFCETLLQDYLINRASDPDAVLVIEAWLQETAQTVVDIASRFLFEQRVFERRQSHELSVDELNELMLDTQRETYGDGLDELYLHPYMWAVKGHYYDVDEPFYNFPYLFGLLFGVGLYARSTQDPSGFVDAYDDLLSSTGMADAATLAGRFGIDLRAPEFWNEGINVLRGKIDRFIALTDDGRQLPD